MICLHFFSSLAFGFSFENSLESASKSFFFALAPGSGFGAALSAAMMYQKVSLCKIFVV